MADQPRDGKPWEDRSGTDQPGGGGAGRPDDRAPDEGHAAPLDETRPQEAYPSDGPGQDPWAGGEDPWAGGADTTVLPPAGETAEQPENRWTARAGVPPATEQSAWPETESDADSEKRWWAPALIGLLALLLLAMLGLGIWLIARSRNNPPGPGPSPSATAPSQTPSPAPPTSAPPSPTASAAALVAVPPLVGLSQADAEQLLRDRQLKSTVETRVAPNTTPGTVLEATPAPGTMVAAGSTVHLVVAAAPPPPTTPNAPPTTPGSTPTNGG